MPERTPLECDKRAVERTSFALIEPSASAPRTRAPRPIADFREVLPVSVDVDIVLDEFVGHRLLQVVPRRTELRELVDDVCDEVEAVQSVLDPHVECGGDGS